MVNVKGALFWSALHDGFGERVYLRTNADGGRFVTRVTHGPHSGHKEYSYTEKHAKEVHLDWERRITTGFYDCQECDGNGRVECFSDRAVWGASGLAGHTTDHWEEDCKHCEDGTRFDEDCHPGETL
ncbi:MAG: hypothetical protein Unbinned3992contig1000_43 [Prokaryotic dsDNA virus sp.]|nr:MAG: hypothetical protein Unbinned3992contig1000_43 [Prokaryotic dsDNA virus sp.]